MKLWTTGPGGKESPEPEENRTDSTETLLSEEEVSSDYAADYAADAIANYAAESEQSYDDGDSLKFGYPEMDLPRPKASFSYSLICFLVILAVSVITVIAVNMNRSSITMVMNSPEIANGNNPDGSPFDIYDFISDEVLTAACEKLNNEVDVDTLKAHLWVDGSTSQQSFNSVRQSILDGVENFSYFPSSYTLSYSVISDNIKAAGFIECVKAVFGQFMLPSKTEILDAVAEVYTEYYEDRYVNTGDSLIIDWGDTDSLDHFNRITSIRSVINRMSRYLSEKYNENATFVSSDGTSFGDLSTELNRIASVDVENYEAFVVQNGVTNDRDRLLTQLRNVSIKNSEQYQRSSTEHNIMLEGIELYDPNTTRVVFIPTLDEQYEFYMNRTQVGIDYLTNKAEDAQHTADEALNTVTRYNTLINLFSTGAWNNDQLLVQAELLYNDIIDKLNEFSERALTVNEEYINSESYERANVQSSSSGVGIISSAVSVVKTAVILSAFFFSLYFVYILIKKICQRIYNTNKEGDDSYDRA